MNFKTIISIIALVLTFIGYYPYFRDLLSKKIQPHIFSWFIWGIATTIIFALQISAGAGVGAWVTITVALISFSIFFLGLRNGDKNIKRIDIVFLVLALLGIPLWLLADQPVLSVVLLCTIDALGFAPTVRKSWNSPYSETLSFYAITSVRHAFSIWALVEYNIITMLFPSIWVTFNALFAILLFIRRRKISPPAAQ